MSALLGIDIGGTFTDFVVLDPRDGSVTVAKVPTTPADPADAVLAGVEVLAAEHGVDLANIKNVVHATTLVTNALIERKGAKVGLLTTDGFRDILEARREERYDVYDLFLEFPPPIVPRHLRLGVRERMLRSGVTHELLDEDSVRDAAATLREAGVEAVAVCLLHSYRNPEHEQAVAALLADALPGIPVSLSSAVMPEIGEYERTMVTVVNAYVQPLAATYLAELETRLADGGLEGMLFIMLSNAGISTPEVVARHPVRMIESGPAAGVLCAQRFGREVGESELISFDMGGTTAKIGVIDHGEPLMAPGFEVARVHRFKRGSGLPIRVPVVDVIEIGAGGGSIAQINQAGLLQIGPESAGADPGPVCYGLGGTLPTVTDANLVLGLLSPGFFLGGRMTLDADAAEQSVREHIADRLELDVVETAWGIRSAINENMVAALRVHLAEKGKDPTKYTLMAFGGGGPLHAAEVARELGVRDVLVPLGAGVASALGAVLAAPAFDFARSFVGRLDDVDWDELEHVYAAMEESGREILGRAGVSADEIVFRRMADMRYEGQVYDIEVAIPDGLGDGSRAQVDANFEEEYRRRYARVYGESKLQITTCRLRASGPQPDVNLAEMHRDLASGSSADDARKGEREIYESPEIGWVTAAVYDRYRLGPGTRIEGPAIVEERESTAILWSGDSGVIDELGNLRIALADRAARRVAVNEVEEV